MASREDRRKLTRCRVLHAALVEFARHGLDGAAVKTISERAGVANGTVFWHFVSKDQLYLETVRLAADTFYREMLPIVDDASFMQVIDRATAFLQAHPDIDALLSSLRGEHPRLIVNEAACLVDARSVSIWQRWIAQSRANGHRLPPPHIDGNLARIISTTVSAVFATRFLEAGSEVRTVLADFGALIESSPFVQAEDVFLAEEGAGD